jgi:hypothetical protein
LAVDDLDWDWLESAAATADHDDNLAQWAEAAHNKALARSIWVENGATLDQEYYDRAVPLVTQQLGLSGLRVARYLNDVFGSTQCSYGK